MDILRVYFDNVIVSGRVLGDLVPDTEMKAVLAIEAAHIAGRIKRVTSRESSREQQRTQDVAKRARLAAAEGELSAVSTDYADLASLLGGGSTDRETVLFPDFRRIGLKEADARHLVNAVTTDCDRFVTTDPHFLSRRAALETHCGRLKIVAPTDLAAELNRASME